MVHIVWRKNLKKIKAKPTLHSILMAGYSWDEAQRHRIFLLGLISSGLLREGQSGQVSLDLVRTNHRVSRFEDSSRRSAGILWQSTVSTASRRILSKYLRRAWKDGCVKMIELMKTIRGANTKKLHLVLDLDNTLLHSVRTDEMWWQDYDGKGPQDFYMSGERLTKLRPFVLDFLQEANTMFNLTVYTMGVRHYGWQMVKLLDLDGAYFGNRVITREDCTQKGRKSLDVVPAAESDVIIIDDLAEVWPDHGRNLIRIKPYNYFPTATKTGKEDNKRVFRKILKRLRRIHNCYMWAELGFGGTKDVRVLLQCIKH
ncbi:hypothetical protein MLD38_020537 [Melastoma candidum]|uniref:Uncharacterized protein n=1 Tax=Melastoma candidum TaxID=119954 RepID=A0ACB9QG95_9MYRT|nr:hypothetical protein MLD38_020537 [Melastoma candidum]